MEIERNNPRSPGIVMPKYKYTQKIYLGQWMLNRYNKSRLGTFYISGVSPYVLADEALAIDGFIKPEGMKSRRWVLLNKKYILETMTGIKLEKK